MKKTYETATIELLKFEQDVVTASGGAGGSNDFDTLVKWDW